MVAVTNVRLTANDRGSRLSGLIDSEEIWYQFPLGVEASARGEPFLAFALFLGMVRGEDIAFDDTAPLFPQVIAALDGIQKILKMWTPKFSLVSVTAVSAPNDVRNAGVVSTFSAGVDSSYTFLKARQEITHFLTLNSFDVAEGDINLEKLQEKIEYIADEFGKTAIAIECNSNDFITNHDMRWTYVHGPFLCLLVGYIGFAKAYIPSSYTYRELDPWGSHPLLDPLWSTETTTIVHHGADTGRAKKTEAIARDPALLKHLQVCWNSKTTNCGRCSKCARTQLVLDLLGQSSTLFPPASRDVIAGRLDITNDHMAAFGWDIMQLALEHDDIALAEILKRKLNRYGIQRDFRQVRRGIKAWFRLRLFRDRRARILGRGSRTAQVRLAEPDPVFD